MRIPESKMRKRKTNPTAPTLIRAAITTGLALAAGCHAPGSSSHTIEDHPPHRRVTAIPQATRAAFALDPFYEKHVDADGFPVVSSHKVSAFALLEAAYLIDRMLTDRPDIRAALIRNRVRLAVMAYDERTTDIPEHSDLEPARFWDKRARGLGATFARPAVSCAEENMLGYPGDPYAAENILIHEFAHTMHEMGMNSIDDSFDADLQRAFDEATSEGLWQGTYAATNHKEYWAEGVQSWFDTNRPPDHQHNHVDTREELQEYDPKLAALIQSVYGDRPWRYRRPADRPHARHLRGFDPTTAPTFEWSPDLLAWYEQYTATRKRDAPE